MRGHRSGTSSSDFFPYEILVSYEPCHEIPARTMSQPKGASCEDSGSNSMGEAGRTPLRIKPPFFPTGARARSRRDERFLAEGKLPNLAALRDRGDFKPLASTLPPISPVAWSSFQTGVNPGKHNIFDFLTLTNEPTSRS